MTVMSTDSAHPSRSRKKRGIVRGVLDLITSIWFGVALLVVLFFYCSIGSAVPAVRQLPAMEMTEFEWFHWWPFDTLIALLCISLAVTTIRRIPLRLVTAGVWAIHGGIILLCLGSYLYFGTKIEGDAPIFRRQVVISLPGAKEPARLVCLPGASTSLIAGPDEWQFSIQSTNTDWPILSDEHKGETAYAVNVSVAKTGGESFIRQILAGYPQYTEDVIPGKGRAIKNIGRKLVEEDLSIELNYEPQEYFHVMDTWALYVRRPGEPHWRSRPIADLPRYNDFVSSREDVFVDFPMPTRVLDLEVPPNDTPDALSGESVRVTSYLQYASMTRRWREGDGQLNPVLRVTTPGRDGTPTATDLVAFDRNRSHMGNGLARFVWLENDSDLTGLPTTSVATVDVRVAEKDASLTIPVNERTVAGGSGEFTPFEDTGFSYRIRNVADNLSISGGTVSVAMVDVRTPESTVFTRMVADRAEMTKDLHGDSNDPHAPAQKEAKPLDERISMTYHPASAPLIFVATASEKLYFIHNGPEGRELMKEMTIGQPIEVVPGFAVRADAYMARGVSEVKPFVFPKERRDRDVRSNMSMIRLEVGSGSSVKSYWLPFNQYAFDSDQYTGGGRFAYHPQPIRLSDGSVVEVLFSRERRRLPSPIALEEFELLTHLGGYTGSASTIRNYRSRLRFFEDNQWTAAVPIEVNQPTEHGGYWYFQSTWDPPQRGMAGSGMNYTGVGVGNRNGVHIQLAGCCIAVLGMIFAFYIKPIIIRQRRERSRAKISAGRREDTEREETHSRKPRPVAETAV